ADGLVPIVQGRDMEVIQSIHLYQNYPNPFNPVTTIEFQIPNTDLVFLKIHDILGQEIETLIDQPLPAGWHQLHWDASNIPSGVYFYQLTAGNHQAVRKMLLIK
ncbi:MAG: T9SS type A sorting domain-containing protein, partial [Calditrichia bacterium]